MASRPGSESEGPPDLEAHVLSIPAGYLSPRLMVLKCSPPSDLPGGLVKTQIRDSEFLNQSVWAWVQKCAFLLSFQMTLGPYLRAIVLNIGASQPLGHPHQTHKNNVIAYRDPAGPPQ